MEQELDKQLAPYIETLVGQTLSSIEALLSSGDIDFNRKEVIDLLKQFEDEFSEYSSLLSPQIQGKILEINHYILKNDEVYDKEEVHQNIPFFDDNAKE